MEANIKVVYDGEEYLCNSLDERSFDLPKDQQKLFHPLIHKSGHTLRVPLSHIKKASC